MAKEDKVIVSTYSISVSLQIIRALLKKAEGVSW